MYIVGLGNPGSEYAETRHNIGFAVVDALAEKLDIEFRAGRGEYLIGSARYRGKNLSIVKPLTYVNNSGIAVREIVDDYGMDLSELLVVSDDLHLPLGTIRLRLKGSDGGHNGLYSIIYHLSTDQFPRLRCGIGSDAMPKNSKERKDFVLSSFEEEESGHVRTMIDEALDAALTSAVEGIQTAMNRCNTRKV